VTAQVVPKRARIYAQMRGREYFLKRIVTPNPLTSESYGPEHLEWVGEEKDSTVFDGAEAVMLATNWGVKFREIP